MPFIRPRRPGTWGQQPAILIYTARGGLWHGWAVAILWTLATKGHGAGTASGGGQSWFEACLDDLGHLFEMSSISPCTSVCWDVAEMSPCPDGTKGGPTRRPLLGPRACYSALAWPLGPVGS